MYHILVPSILPMKSPNKQWNTGHTNFFFFYILFFLCVGLVESLSKVGPVGIDIRL